MRVFVTGGAGYVGSHCVRALCDAGHSVVVFDNLTSGGHREAVDGRAALVVGDLSDSSLLDQTLASTRFDSMMHFAGLTQVNESVREPLQYYRNNVAGTVNLLEAMRRHDVRNFVFSSSCAVYGVPLELPIREDARSIRCLPYGRTKLMVEWILEDCAAAWGLGATALRYFNAAGAAADASIGEDHSPETHLIPRVLQVALGLEKEVQVFGTDYASRDGSCVRDYVHVEDLAKVHLLAMSTQQPGRFRAYNVGTGRGASVLEVIENCRRITGREIPVTLASRRAGDPPELYADAAPSMSELGWRPVYTEIGPIIETAWRWHRRRPAGFGSARPRETGAGA